MELGGAFGMICCEAREVGVGDGDGEGNGVLPGYVVREREGRGEREDHLPG